MVITDDEFRDFVVKTNDGKLQCKFCGQLFAAKTSITRFKWHWSGVEGHGVKICAQVTTDILQAAYQAIQQASNKRRKVMPSSSSSNMHEVVHEQINGVGNLEGEQGRMQMELRGIEQGVLREEIAPSRTNAEGNHMENMTGGMTQLIGRSFSPDRLIIDAQYETREDARQVTDKVGHVELEGTNWNDIARIAHLMEVGVENGVVNMVREPGHPVARDSSLEDLQSDGDESSGDAFPTKKLVGGEFEKNKNAIWSWLMNDEASSSLAVYGMGGVGKTTLLTHIYNLLLETPNSFHHVSWITVSQDFCISKLQNLIASEFHLDLSREDNRRKRAAKLSKELCNKKQWVIILDDLWDYFDFDEVGIPIQVKGCKVMLTTRLFGVCQRMLCKIIKVEPLSNEAAWFLFTENLGRDTTLPPRVEQIAKSITRECAGLPLGIKTMAGAMRGVVDIREWRNVLLELEESRVRQDDMEPEVFRILRVSYTHLKDSALQQCFLYCSLFPEDFEIDRNDLIGYLIDEGVLKRMKSRQAEFDKGHAMLNKLQNVCLLERGRYSSNGSVRMHDLMRDMALQILQENSPVIVKAGAQLKELPETEEWTENLVRVSLMQNRIEDIHSSHSPTCPSLSTLLLCRNEGLRSIANSFFEQLRGLKILDLSYTNIKILSDPVSDFVGLTALLLIGCVKLQHVPSLKKLRALKRLDLSRATALKNLPQGMKCLTNLRYLRLNGCGQKKFPSGILPKLLHLQVLIIEENWKVCDFQVRVKGKEVARLRKLETLECRFEGRSDFVNYLKSRDGTQALNTYKLFVGKFDPFGFDEMTQYNRRNRSVGLGNLSIKGDVDFQLMFPNNIEELWIYNCYDAMSLCDVSSSIKYAAELECINIFNCSRMECLVSSSWLCSSPLSLPSYNGIFSGLKEFYCVGCTNMKKLFPLVLLPNLINLEVIRVLYCDKMEEIIGTRDEESSSNNNRSISELMNLPKLRILYLNYLPELKSICSAKLICDSLQQIWIRNCPELKRIPIFLPLLDNGQPSPPPSLDEIKVYPKEWWESVVEWEQTNAKDVLLPFVQFIW